MLIDRERRRLALALKAILLITAGAVLLMPKLEPDPGVVSWGEQLVTPLADAPARF